MNVKTLSNTTIEIAFPLSTELLLLARSLEGRSFVPSTRTWVANNSVSNLMRLREANFKLDAKAEALLDKAWKPKRTINKDVKLTIPTMGKTLMPFQVEGVRWLHQKRGVGLLADEQGLGKTIQALAYAIATSDKSFPVLVVTLASLKYNWRAEIHSLDSNLRVHIFNGRTSTTIPEADFYIINYDILAAWKPTLQKHLNLRLIILDECQKIKNNKAGRTKATLGLASDIKKKIALSGTPITSRPIEFYNIIKLLNPNLVGTRWQFGFRYCNAKLTQFGWDLTGASNTKELHKLVSEHIMLRRLKLDVLKELPPKTIRVIPVDISNRKEYSNITGQVKGWYLENKDRVNRGSLGVEVKAKLSSLRLVAVRGMLDSVYDWIDNYLESGNKLTVYAWHREIVETIYAHYKSKAVVVYGGVPPEERHVRVQKFQNDPECKLFIGNVLAAGTGLTLTAACQSLIVESSFSPGDMKQVEDRIHRITQKHHVFINYMVAINTVMERIVSVLDKQMKVVTGVLDGTDVPEDELLVSLLKGL